MRLELLEFMFFHSEISSARLTLSVVTFASMESVWPSRVVALRFSSSSRSVNWRLSAEPEHSLRVASVLLNSAYVMAALLSQTNTHCPVWKWLRRNR